MNITHIQSLKVYFNANMVNGYYLYQGYLMSEYKSHINVCLELPLVALVGIEASWKYCNYLPLQLTLVSARCRICSAAVLQ